MPFRHAFSLEPALPQLYAYAKSTTESKRERGDTGEWDPARAEQRRGVGRTGKEESSRGKGASRGREN